jgi:uncharacterized protein
MGLSRPPLPPFVLETAIEKVWAAEDTWNTRDPERVSLAYTEDSVWRNRARGLWGFRENRIAVRFQYEWHDPAGQWFRSYGNELWEFDERGLMRTRS